MFAFVGYCVQSNFVFPWPETLAGAAHPSVDLSPEAQWDAVPVGAKWQIFAVISLLELWDECGGGGVLPHYTKGRQPGKYPSFQPFRDAVHPVFDLYGTWFASSYSQRGVIIIHLSSKQYALPSISRSVWFQQEHVSGDQGETFDLRDQQRTIGSARYLWFLVR